MFGRLLKTLVGYTDQPDGLQLIAWLGVVAMMLTLMRLVNRPKVAPSPQVMPQAAE
jgi:high-affinity Fe2+/Pb2+ permease